MLDWLLFEPTSAYTTMFSGIIASVGHITTLTPRNDGSPTVRLTVEAGSLGLDDVELGDSIACNGMCLTVARHSMRNHGGDVTLTDRPGGGAICTIRHPLERKIKDQA